VGYLTVDGKASHAGSAPDKGVNTLVELSQRRRDFTTYHIKIINAQFLRAV
jgi:hypothetical protein